MSMNPTTELANAARRLLHSSAVQACASCDVESTSLQKALDRFDARELEWQSFASRVDETKLICMWHEAVGATASNDGPHYDQSAMVFGQRLADYIDHLRKLMKLLNDNADLAGLIYQVRDNELKGWDGPRVQATGEAIAGIQAELKAAPNDG